MEGRTARIAGIIVGVLEQALEDARADRLVLLLDGTPEAALLERLLARPLSARLATITAAGPSMPELLAAWAEAAGRYPSGLVAIAVNKTAALLGGALPGPVLPLADLWASQIAALCGDWSAPAPVRDLAAQAGGIDALDRTLGALVDERRPPAEVLALLPDGLGGTVLALWEDTRFARRRLGLVPKLGTRTIGVDLFD